VKKAVGVMGVECAACIHDSPLERWTRPYFVLVGVQDVARITGRARFSATSVDPRGLSARAWRHGRLVQVVERKLPVIEVARLDDFAAGVRRIRSVLVENGKEGCHGEAAIG